MSIRRPRRGRTRGIQDFAGLVQQMQSAVAVQAGAGSILLAGQASVLMREGEKGSIRILLKQR